MPDAWDEGEETADEVWTTVNEESTAGEEEVDSLPDLVSSSEDSGYEFLNTPTNDEKDFKATAAEDKPSDSDKRDTSNNENEEEEELEESINFILNMEDPDYKTPEPCIGLTCPLTGEQYYVNWKKTKKNAVAYPKKKNYIFILYTLILYFTYIFNTLRLI